MKSQFCGEPHTLHTLLPVAVAADVDRNPNGVVASAGGGSGEIAIVDIELGGGRRA